MASIMIDFPAPVSPVKTVNPLRKEIDKDSIMAKFLIESSANKKYSPRIKAYQGTSV